MGIESLIALVGYGLCMLSYAVNVPRAFRSRPWTLFYGSMALVAGYFILATYKMRLLTTGEDDKQLPSVGYGILAAFFALPFVVPLNFKVRFYDPLAVVGYTLLFAATLRPDIVPAELGWICIALYYTLGAAVKLGQPGEMCLLIGRYALAVYSGFNLCEKI